MSKKAAKQSTRSKKGKGRPRRSVKTSLGPIIVAIEGVERRVRTVRGRELARHRDAMLVFLGGLKQTVRVQCEPRGRTRFIWQIPQILGPGE